MRWIRATAAVAALLTGAGTFQAPLSAEPSSTPRFDWLFENLGVFGNDVAATVRIGDVVYAGGSFRSVSPTSGALGTLFQVSPSSGAPVGGLPIVNGDISVLAADGAGGYFLAGQFTNIGRRSGGTATTGSFQLAHVLADGSVDPAFGAPPQVTGNAQGIVRVGASVVLRGFFTVNGVTRRLIALDPATGAVSPWVAELPPIFGQEPEVTAIAGANGVLYAIFVANQNLARRVAAYDGTTGATLWMSQPVGRSGLLPGGVIAVSGGRVMVTVERLYALDASTGAIDPAWGSADTTGIGSMSASGGTLFVSGSFTTLDGQPRASVGAIDVATGHVTAWQPALPFSNPPVTIAATATGGAFAAGLICMPPGNNCRQEVVQIDASGAVTAWTAQVSIGLNLRVLLLSAAGNVVMATQQVSRTGSVSRLALAAFDAVTGALLPSPVLSGLIPGSGTDTSVTGLVARGSTLYLSGTFTAVDGVPRTGMAAVDTRTGTLLSWAPAAPTRVVFTLGPHVYTAVRLQVGSALRRVDAASGAMDTAWQPPALIDAVVDRGRIVAVRDAGPGPSGGAAVGELDPMTGSFSEWWRTAAVTYSGPEDFRTQGGRLALDGDTLYLVGPRPDVDYVAQRDVAETVVAFDRPTGVILGQPVQGYINGVTIADGHAIVTGGRIIVNGVERLELAELAQPAGVTPWRPDWPLFGAPVSFTALQAFNYIRGALGAVVAGDLLLVRGRAAGDPTPFRLTAYPLTGATVPSGLRSQIIGPTTIFSWDPMPVPPAGGYVIEGGFGRGETAAALPVGAATSVALPMPGGPVFIRVRAQGATETSNEIVAGCLAPPLPPTALTAAISGAALTLSWTAPAAAVTTYTIAAGTTSGASDVATLSLSGSQTSISGPVAGGSFFVRAIAANTCGTSGPSGEVFFTMGAPDPLPAAPTNLAAMVTGNTVSLSWAAPSGPVTGYVVEAGTASGLANLGTLRVGPASSLVLPGVPAGVYAVRVRAVTSAGSGAPSADVIIGVP